MKTFKTTLLISLIFILLSPKESAAQTLLDSDNNLFKISGYLRTGLGYSEAGETQAHFQMPGALNKYSLGNQADTYGELEFDYTYFLNSDRSKSIDAVWMVSIYEAFGSKDGMSFNNTEQLYLRANNLLGLGESIWFGNRFYDRRAIHMLDRQWMNPGQKGWGAGIENLLNKSGDEDIKIAAWQLKDKDVVSYKNGITDNLTAYTADVRWVHIPITDNSNINFALNYSYRMENSTLGYDGVGGFGAFTWLDYTKESISNTTALLFRQGANIAIDHWGGMSQKENPGNDNLVLNNLQGAYSLEINNNFLYDNMESFSVNAILMLAARNYGTKPYYYEDGNKAYIADRESMFYWLSGGARAMYYVSKRFRPSFEYTYEYGHNEQLGVNGSLHRLTFSPELSLAKGFYSRPVLRPFVTYALWSDDLKGYVGTTPSGAPYADTTRGFTYGLQFEIWW